MVHAYFVVPKKYRTKDEEVRTVKQWAPPDDTRYEHSPETSPLFHVKTPNTVTSTSIDTEGTTPIPEDDFCWDFFEMYDNMTGSSAKLGQWNASFVGILLGQTPAIGGNGRYDRATCRDIKQTCREVARARHIERRLLQLGHSDNRRHRGRPNTLLVLR